MHNDEVIWQCLGGTFCSYNVKIGTNEFCRHRYNVTGLCNRVSCPLANGNYATVIEEEGKCYLSLKTIERAHIPNRMWEKIELSGDYKKALEQITLHMTNTYKTHEMNRCKLKFTRLRQTLLRMRRMQLETQTTMVPVKRKIERREALREKKALIAAKLEISIEQELLNRLQQGVYGEVYNHDMVPSELTQKDKEKEEVAVDPLDLEFVEAEDEMLDQYEKQLVSAGYSDDELRDIEGSNEKNSVNQKMMIDKFDIKNEDRKKRIQSCDNSNKIKRFRKSQSQFKVFEDILISGPRVEIEYEYEAPLVAIE